MMDDTVGKPIFFMDDAKATTTEGIIESFAGMAASLNINPAVVILIMARFEALARAVDDGEADGIIIGSCNGESLSLMICDKNGERILEQPVPNVSDEMVAAWIIKTIQSVGLRLNLVTDPTLCQCFCGFAGHPDEWLEILMEDII